MVSVLFMIIFTLECLTVILHSVGLFCLAKLRRTRIWLLQFLYICNLSVAELLAVSFFLVENVFELLEMYEMKDIISSFPQITIRIVFYATRLAITLDKFFVVFLNIKYHIYWNMKKARILVASMWLLGITMCAIVVSMQFCDYYDISDAVIDQTVLAFDFLFLFVFIASYTYIFIKYKQSKLCPTSTVSNHNTTGLFKLFRESRFFISVLLIISFISLIVLPDLVIYFIKKDEPPDDEHLDLVLFLFYHVSFIVDSCIYIFLQPFVRRVLWKQLYKLDCLPRDANENIRKRIASITLSQTTAV